jgi:thymidylate synthase (FAD)
MALKVVPIAQTIITYGRLSECGFQPQDEDLPTFADELAEFAGRACYQSWDRPNPATANNEGYMANILKQGHESVLEHASITFYVTGVSRYMTHEIVRHRHASWSQLSTRYVDESDSEIVRHPGMNDQDWAETVEFFAAAQEKYAAMVERMTARGLKRKEAREAARFVLPGGMETKIVMTGNVRAWRDMLKKRYHVAADAEIREFATEVLNHLREFAPNSFQDFPDKPFGSED